MTPEQRRKWEEANRRANALWSQNSPSRRPIQQPAPPKQSFFNKIRDVFDANTDADRYRRQLANKPVMYADQQRQAGYGRVSNNPFQRTVNAAKSVGEAFYQTPKRLGEAVEEKLYGQRTVDAQSSLANRQRELLAKFESKATNPTLSLEERALQRSLANKMRRQMGVSDRDQKRALALRKDKLDPKKNLAAIADAALTIASAGVGGVALKTAGSTAAKFGFKQAGKGLIKPLLVNAGLNAAQGMTDVVANVGVGRQASGKDILRGGAFGATAGSVADLALGGIPAFRAYRGYGRALSELAETQNTAAVKGTLRNITDNLDDDTLDTISEQIAKTTDTKEIDNILKKAADIEADVAKNVASDSTNVVDKDLVRAFKEAKTPQQTRDAVKTLFPDLDEPTLVQTAKALAESKDDKTVASIIEALQIRRKAVTEGVDTAAPKAEAIAPTPEQQIAEVAQEQPTAQLTSKQAPDPDIQANQPQGVVAAAQDATVPGTTAVKDVPGAFPIDEGTKTKVNALVAEASSVPTQPGYKRLYQGNEGTGTTPWFSDNPQQLAQYFANRSDNVIFRYVDVPEGSAVPAPGKPGFFQINESATQTPALDTIQAGVQATEAARKSGQENKLISAAKSVKRELVDPLQEWQRADDQLAKRLGVREQDLDPERALTQLYTRVQSSAEEAARLAEAPTATGESLAQVMNRNMANENEFLQYLNQKFALEILEKSDNNPRMWKIKGFTPEQVAEAVARYEQANPQVIADAKTVKAWADSLIDKGVAAGEITKEFGDFIKGRYQNYVPLSKVFDEDLVRPRIVGGMGTNVAEQNVVRFLGEGAAEFDDTFDSLIQRGEAVTKKANQNTFNNELLRRAKEGDTSLKLTVDPDKVAARREVVKQLKETRDVLAKAKKARGKLATKKGYSKRELAQAQTEAAERMRQYYVSQAPEGSSGNFANKMSREELLDLFEVATEASEVKAKRIANKLAKKGAQYKEAIAQLDELRAEIGTQKGNARELFKESAQLNQKATPNKNLIRGFRNGDEFAVEVSPAMAKQAEYVNTLYDGTAGTIGNISSTVAAPAKALHTGFLAPVFSAKQIIKQQGTKFIQSEGLSAFGLRPMTQGYFGGLFAKGGFYDQIVEAGFKPIIGTKVGKKANITAKQLAASVDKWSKLKYTVKTPRKWLDTINSLAGRLDTADRVQIGLGEFLRRKRMGYTDAEATRFAARQANDALGDFRRVSKLARGMEGITPYSGATQAGYRALMRRFKTNPVQTSIKVMTLLAPVVAAAKYGAEKHQDYYEDMIESGRTFDLDTNAVIMTPGAHRATDEEIAASNGELKDGDWVGVIKIPVAPDYNPLTRAAWKTGYALSKGEAPDIKMLAGELSNFITGDQKRNYYDDSMGREGIGRVLPSSSTKNLIVTASGVEPRTGRPIANDRLRTKPRTEQYTSITSETAKKLSNAFGGALTPQQVDSLFDQAGYVGDLVQSASRGGLKQAATAPFKKAFFGSKGQSSGAKYYKDLDEVSRTAFTDDKQWQAWQEMLTRRTDKQGNRTENGMLDSAKDALTLLSNEEVFRAQAEMNRRAAKRTGNSNPLFDDTLTPQQRNAVLTYRSMRVNNAAKQNYTKDGEPAFTSLGLDEKWYSDFQKKESAFWDKVEADKKKRDKISEAQGKAPSGSSSDEEYTPRTFSGSKRPELTDAQKKLEEQYYKLPKGTGDRTRFLNANPWLIAHWDAMNNFTNDERKALGFKPLTEDDVGYSSVGSGKGKLGYSKRYGGRGGSKKEAERRLYLSQLLGNVPTASITQAQVKATPSRTKFKVKLPGGRGRNYKRIKLN